MIRSDEMTTAGGLICSECGANTYTLINTCCLACATKILPARGSWICARCDASNAPHVDRCACQPEPATNWLGTYWYPPRDEKII